MKTRTRIFGLAAAAALAAGAATYAVTASAQGDRSFGPPFMHGAGPHGMVGMHRGPMAGPFADTTRLDAFKKELGITTAQEPAWAAYAKTLQDTAGAMKSRHQGMDMGKMHAMSEKDRQAMMAGMHEQGQKSFQAVKAAAEKLLMALDETQKTKARESLPGLRAAGPGMMGHQSMHGPGMGPGGPHHKQ
jgi:hypothetical protein